MIKDSIGGQIQALENLQGFLRQFSDQLRDSAEQYHRYVKAVEDEGGVERIVVRYQDEFMASNLVEMHSLIDRINSEDSPYVGREIEHLESAGRQ